MNRKRIIRIPAEVVKGRIKLLVRDFLAPLAACEFLFMCYYENQSDRRCRNGDVPERYRALFGKAPLPGSRLGCRLPSRALRPERLSRLKSTPISSCAGSWRQKHQVGSLPAFHRGLEAREVGDVVLPDRADLAVKDAVVEAARHARQFRKGMAVVVAIASAERGCSILYADLDAPTV
jgi:hypothetical protein